MAQGNIYVTYDGHAAFRSEAPQELIRAESDELKGAIETTSKTFSFKIRIGSFEGFNSQLQRTHFNENYMESSRYPEAIFKGKIIEDIDWQKRGTYHVRAKGMLSIHGVDQERIIKAQVIIGDNKLDISSSFSIMLTDHNIPIPRIVKEKLAEEIKVTISGQLLLR